MTINHPSRFNNITNNLPLDRNWKIKNRIYSAKKEKNNACKQPQKFCYQELRKYRQTFVSKFIEVKKFC